MSGWASRCLLAHQLDLKLAPYSARIALERCKRWGVLASRLKAGDCAFGSAHTVRLGSLTQIDQPRRMARHQMVDRSEFECSFESTRTDKVAQKVIDDQEFEFRVDVAQVPTGMVMASP